MRLGFDRLAQLARERVERDPVEGGALFVFGGRGASRLKVLWFDRNGLCLVYKRYHQARFDLPVAVEMEVAGLPDYQTDLKNPNFAKLAEAMGMMGVRIENPADVSSGGHD
jgi:hypothetical protein